MKQDLLNMLQMQWLSEPGAEAALVLPALTGVALPKLRAPVISGYG